MSDGTFSYKIVFCFTTTDKVQTKSGLYGKNVGQENRLIKTKSRFIVRRRVRSSESPSVRPPSSIALPPLPAPPSSALSQPVTLPVEESSTFLTFDPAWTEWTRTQCDSSLLCHVPEPDPRLSFPSFFFYIAWQKNQGKECCFWIRSQILSLLQFVFLSVESPSLVW